MHTSDEWNYLVQPFDWNWPEEWEELQDDLAHWRPVVKGICDRIGVPFDGSLERARGSNAVFPIGEVVIKINARYSPVWFPREVETLQVLERIPEAKAPRLIAYDDCDRGESGHAWIVMERLPGRPLREFLQQMSPEQWQSVIAQLVLLLRALHSADVTGLKSFDPSPAGWVDRIRARAELAREYLEEGLSPALFEQVPEFLATHLPLVTPEFQPTLLSSDVNLHNILLEERAGEMVVTGHVDFGDPEVGPVEYEWPSVCQKALRSDPDRMRWFFEAYGWPIPIDDVTLGRLKLYSLLHRFPMFHFTAREHPDITSLDELLERQWQGLGAGR